MEFDVVICTKNSALTLDVCLTSLFRSDIPIKKIFVIDKNSMDGTKEIAKKYGCVVVSNNMSLAEARRFGAQLCETEYFVNLDSDIVIPEKFYSILQPHIRNNVLTKGIYLNQLPKKDRQIAYRDFDWLHSRIGSLDCCIIHQETFLRLSKDWEKRGLDAGEDTELFRVCEEQKLPLHQDNQIVSKHYVFSVLRLLKQTRWYGKGSRRGRIKGRFCRTRGEFMPVEMFGLPIMGLKEMIKWKSWKLFFYESAKMIFWFYGYFIG